MSWFGAGSKHRQLGRARRHTTHWTAYARRLHALQAALRQYQSASPAGLAASRVQHLIRPQILVVCHQQVSTICLPTHTTPPRGAQSSSFAIFLFDIDLQEMTTRVTVGQLSEPAGDTLLPGRHNWLTTPSYYLPTLICEIQTKLIAGSDRLVSRSASQHVTGSL